MITQLGLRSIRRHLSHQRLALLQVSPAGTSVRIVRTEGHDRWLSTSKPNQISFGRADHQQSNISSAQQTAPLPGSKIHPEEPSSVPPPPKVKRPTHRLRNFARTVLVLVLSASGYVVWRAWDERNPPEQLPHDPEKKTIVVLGNGWGASSFLKGLDTEHFNVVVISPRNYFCFTPLLPSVTVGTIEPRSVIEPTRFITRHKQRAVHCFEATATEVDPKKKTVRFTDESEIKGDVTETEIGYDYLIYAVGAENNTFGIPGVREHGCFLKELNDAEKIRKKLMDCIETATFKDQSPSEVDRLLHMVVVGGGPTGVEYAAELHDFLVDDLSRWYPEIAGKVKITLIEALPNVLPMFSKQLIDYTTQTFMSNRINVLTKTMVKQVHPKSITALDENKQLMEIPYGLLVWATGNTSRELTRQLMAALPEHQTQRRGLLVDDDLSVLGADGIYALGDCTATSYAPTAQAASQQGQYLARRFGLMAKREKLENQLVLAKQNGNLEEQEATLKSINRTNLKEFKYSHQGSLAYIGSDKAIADLPFFNGNIATGGVATYFFWRSAYVSMAFSFRNRVLVCTDWVKVKLFGRDVSRA
ncbi:NADH dehydrogenase [Puccinia graminis f. sp. tritici CRL 75-36-700-3]|uniref:NADH:ubiquinone reductase (non-electrogenic) n=1 Tax=Puccinia graminis f. sp. tritici (strain CRL 75-36-700-3 / race SCCL) TaxID=418459 RepID=E3KEE5_PUCGT|nr:NADH dehydrogenase [Puccinia graminis f. sp. tritici CRL 75-36-700-3]EFP82678.2 NADH dehydrogenase [Puccinia graminis f. sp. tritici CRL 75-36-700-3]